MRGDDMDLGIDGKVALVAASSRGLGRAVAGELGAAGVDLVICARGEDRLRATARVLEEEHGVGVLAVPADLHRPEGVEKVVDAALEAHGRVDILMTNTGGPPAGAFEEHDRQTWRDAYRSLLEGAVEMVRGVLPGMKERGWGRILTLTSIAVKQPVDGLMLSNTLRAGVAGFARTLANEVAPHGITVNNVMPGYTRTDRTEELARTTARDEGLEPRQVEAAWEEEIPAGRLAEPREFAALVAFLASERAGYITGTSIPVDGGWTRSLL
ncbi:MAG: SDR family oxidoreductase [Gemmatimonadota bacterium]